MNKVYFIFPLIFIVAFAIKHFDENKSPKDLAFHIVDKSISVNAINDILSEIMPIFTADSNFSNKWQINKNPKNNYINLYIVNSESINLHANKFPVELRNNCAYVGFPQIIICDIVLFNDFRTSLMASVGNYDYLTWPKEFDQDLITWVIGHEIGHIINKHKTSHFQKSSLSKDMFLSSDSQKREFDADFFASEKIKKNEVIHDDFLMYLFELLRLYVVKSQGKDLMGPGIPADASHVFALDKESSHPSYIIRALKMLFVLDIEKKAPEFTADLQAISEQLK